MNKRLTIIVITAVLSLIPAVSKADLDILSIVQQNIGLANDKVRDVIKAYTGMEINLQELSTNRNIVNQMKNKVRNELTARAREFTGNITSGMGGDIGADLNKLKDNPMMFFNSSLRSISLPGLGEYINLGTRVNPFLRKEEAKIYLKKLHTNNDIMYTVEKDVDNNNLIIDNLASLFANSLVRRRQIIDEDPCSCVEENGRSCSEEKAKCEQIEKEFQELNDVNVIRSKYYSTVLNGHHRLLRIMEANSNYWNIIAKVNMVNKSFDDVSAVSGEIDDSVEEEASKQEIQDLRSKHNTETIQDILKRMNNKSGLLSDIYDNVKGGNWGGVLNNAVGGASDILNGSGNKEAGDLLGSMSGSAGSALDAALRGDWQGVVDRTTDAVGNAADTQNRYDGKVLADEQEAQRKREECAKCVAENEARQKAGEPVISCLNSCSF